MDMVINSGDLAFMVLTTVLLFFMAPGLAFFYGGLVEKKNALTMMMYTFLSVGVVIILWVLVGFSLVFGEDLWGVIGSPFSYFMLQYTAPLTTLSVGSEVSFLMHFMYQLMFAIIATPLMTGAFVNRMKLGGWIKLAIGWNLLIYFPVAHWVWGGGFLSDWGFVDYAGGTVIHVTAGFAALASVFYFGRRAYIRSGAQVNSVWMAFGGSILLFGSFGFISGGELSGGRVAFVAFTNTAIAGGFASMVWVLLAFNRDRKFSLLEFMTGALSGLVAITPCSGYINPQGAIVLGIVTPFVCFYFRMLCVKMRWDDTLGIWGVHGMGGFLGTILVGCLAVSQVNEVSAGFSQIVIQFLGALFVAAYSFIITYILLGVINVFGSIRVPDSVQEDGLDKHYLKEIAD